MNNQTNTSTSLTAGVAPVRMMTVRQIAQTGILPEHALRMMLKQDELPAIYSGRKALINYHPSASGFWRTPW